MTTNDADKPTTDPEVNPEPDTNRLVAQVRGAMQRISGRVYRVQLERLDHDSLRVLLAFIRDVEMATDSAVRRAKLQPWRR